MFQVDQNERMFGAWTMSDGQKLTLLQCLKDSIEKRARDIKELWAEVEKTEDKGLFQIIGHIIAELADEAALFDKLYPKKDKSPTFQVTVRKGTAEWDSLTAVFNVAYKPQLLDEHMVTLLWADGGITMEKGGAQFGQRTQHQRQKPFVGFTIEDMQLPGGERYIICTDDDAFKIRKEIMRAIVERL